MNMMVILKFALCKYYKQPKVPPPQPFATSIFKQDSKKMKIAISCMGHIDAITIRLCFKVLITHSTISLHWGSASVVFSCSIHSLSHNSKNSAAHLVPLLINTYLGVPNPQIISLSINLVVINAP